MKGENGRSSDRRTASPTRAPGLPRQESLKGEPPLREKTAAKDYELSERRHRDRFRWLSLTILPVLATAWLGLIAWATLTDRIQGIQVGIALGATGAGLLTLLGFQIRWAHSRPDEADRHRVGRVVESVTKHIAE